MGSQLFGWILVAGIFSMLWFLYQSIRQDITHWKPVAIRRHDRHPQRDNTIANG